MTYNDVVVYPNPAINSISIEGSDSISEVIIYNTFGQAVLRFTEFIAAKNVAIDISNLRKGVYVVSGKFIMGGKFRKRIVVTKE